MAVLTTSDLSANLHSYYVKKALEVFHNRTQLYKLGKKTKLPKGQGKQVKWLLWSAVAGSTSALTEGTNPSEISQSTSNVTATIAQYGQFSKFSDLLQMTAIDDVIDSAAEQFGYAARETIESLIISQLDSALTVRYVNNRGAVNSIVAGDSVTMKEFLKAQIALKVALVKPHESGKYVAILHPSSEYDLLAEQNSHAWLDLREMAAPDKGSVMDGELGSVLGMRFVVSDLMSAANNASSISVKNCYLLGAECFGVVDIGSSKEGFEMIIKPADSGGVANPLNMYSTVGYKIGGFVCKNFAAARGILLKGATSYA